MEHLKVIIVDDEAHCRSSLAKQLEWSCEGVEVVGVAASAEEGRKLIVKQNPDIVFLDIEMPGGSGFDMVNSLPHSNVRIVFTTAFDEYALEAFKVHAVAYLLKPIDGDELADTVEKVRREKKDTIGEKLENLMKYLNAKEKVKKVAVPVSDGLQFLRIDDIVRCEADGNYCRIFMNGGNALLISKTLKHIADLINNTKFIRVHQSHYLNTDYIQKYIRGKNGQIILDDGSSIPVSRSKKDDFLENW